MRIGIDVGGTNTDAVLMDADRVLAEVKTSTTGDVTSGIVTALRSLVSTGGVSAGEVRVLMIGTTHFTNAFVEGKGLDPTAAIRLALPATRSLPPMVDWPARLRGAVRCKSYVCHGGHEFDGRHIAPLDRDELVRAAEDLASEGLTSIAVSAVFSPVNAEFEQQAAEILAGELPDVPISLSHELGRLGLLERENATIINACLRGLATRIVGAFDAAATELGISAPIYLSQNDGTLMTVDFAERYPVATFASGPTNSMRGAAFLSGEEDCAVVDIGGTTSDIGVLQHGFPREASVAVRVGGVRTNFRMPDVLSLGIGGGSLVRPGENVEVGPDSVGFELRRRALVFGGDTLTASDLAIAAGRASFGDPSAVAGLERRTVEEGLAGIERRIAESFDRMKTSPEPIPVVLVGGGSILLRDELEGASRVIRPDHFGVANAIGAAIAQVGGEVERVFALAELSRDDALEQAKAEAVDKAVAAGAASSTVRIVDVDEVALSYLPGNATRIKVKAVGELELRRDGGADGR
jgi:N-methylhydantoinase A/oxoprolinase/acetone carboxylase beta subunit